VSALLQLFQDQGLDYAIGGSVASSHHGEPRTTQDIDLSIVLDEAGAAALIQACEEAGWYISPEETNRAAHSGGSFSVNDGFWKADIFVVRDAFGLEAMTRRQQEELFLTDEVAWFLSPEDTILHKLRWCAGQPLDKHLRDITAILHVQGDDLDLDLITRWAIVFDAGMLWAGLLDAYRQRRLPGEG
jgi:hypothetical protein